MVQVLHVLRVPVRVVRLRTGHELAVAAAGHVAQQRLVRRLVHQAQLVVVVVLVGALDEQVLGQHVHEHPADPGGHLKEGRGEG